MQPLGCILQCSTPVLIKYGYKEIQNIQVGDTVWAYNDTTGQLAQKRVVNIFQYERDSVYHISLANGTTINATSDHPFFVGGKWLRVHELKVGDYTALYNDGALAITHIEIVAQPATVYNFEVEDFHTYYVSEQRVLVHNSNCNIGKKPHSNATSGNNAAAQKGQAKHKELDERVGQKEGWQNSKDASFRGNDGKMYKPDVKTKSGNYLEYKPNTPRGRSRGRSQIKKYKEQHPDPNAKFRLIYYTP
jgi:hypothetical protein